MNTPWSTLNVTPVINAAGKMTALGGSAQHDGVAKAQADAAGLHVDLAELRQAAGARIAEICGAEAGCVTAGCAPGIADQCGGVHHAGRPALVHRLPETPAEVLDEVLLQAGHLINFGAPIEQMIRLGGGRTHIVGWTNSVSEAQLQGAIETGHAAAMLFVQSHHCVQEHQVPLSACIDTCHAYQVPVIVDAAAEEDLQKYIKAGADLVIYSGGKAIGGPTSGFIVGRHDLIAACEAQQSGIGRAMKVGKEQIAGLLVALDQYQRTDTHAEQNRRERVNARIKDALSCHPEADVEIALDRAGRDIERVSLRARDDAFDVMELVRYLAGGKPSIRTRNHGVAHGVLQFDPRELTEAQAAVIAERLNAFFRERR